MNILIPEYPDARDPGATVEAAAWPSVVQVGPLDASGRVALQLWMAGAAYKPGAAPLGGEEFGPGNGLPPLAEMLSDPAFAVPWTLLGHYLLTQAAGRWKGATVELTEQEKAVVDAFGAFLQGLAP